MSQQIAIDIESLQKVANDIVALDASIAAAGGNEAAVRKTIVDGFIADNSSVIDSIIDKLIPQFSELETEVLVGLVGALPAALTESFQDRVDTLVTDKVKEATSSAAGDVASLRTQRKEKVDAFKALKAILEQFQIDTSSVPDPKRGGGRPAGSGSGAPKSGTNKEGYRYTMDGAKRPASQNSLSSLAYYATNGCAGTEKAPERWGTKQLKDFLATQGVTWGAPGEGDDEWNVTLPNGKEIGAYRYSEETDPELFPAVSAAAE